MKDQAYDIVEICEFLSLFVAIPIIVGADGFLPEYSAHPEVEVGRRTNGGPVLDVGYEMHCIVQ
jgi:hypothetical protein